MTRTLTLFLYALLPLIAICQSGTVHLFRIDGVPNGHAIKSAHEAVVFIDPQAVLSFDGARVKIRSTLTSSTSLLNALNSTGTASYSMDAPIGRAGLDQVPPFPVRIDSGDPALDDERYALAKQAWINADPAAYQLLLDTRQDQLPPTTKQP